MAIVLSSYIRQWHLLRTRCDNPRSHVRPSGAVPGVPNLVLAHGLGPSGLALPLSCACACSFLHGFGPALVPY